MAKILERFRTKQERRVKNPEASPQQLDLLAWVPPGLILLSLFFIRPVFGGGSLYYEFESGVTQFRQATSFYGSDVPSNSQYGMIANLGLFYGVIGKRSTFAEIQLGIQGRYNSASAGTYTLSFAASYASLRIQASRLFLAGGVAPFVWKSGGDSASVSGLKRSAGSLALMGQMGFLFPVVPIFSLGFVGSAQLISTGGQISPKPAYDGTFLMRFYFELFGLGSLSDYEQRSIEWYGWRYPFGEIR